MTHALDGERVSVGAEGGNDIRIDGDRSVSRLHAVFARVGPGWSLKDLGSRNGTFVNGERLHDEHALRHGDEIQTGSTRMLFRASKTDVQPAVTQTADPPPRLTPRERDVLIALCRPVLEADLFTEPASIRQLARKLVVTEAAIKQHLARLYDKFELFDEGERRRLRLANEAIRRGAVTISDLRTPP